MLTAEIRDYLRAIEPRTTLVQVLRELRARFDLTPQDSGIVLGLWIMERYEEAK